MVHAQDEATRPQPGGDIYTFLLLIYLQHVEKTE